MSARTARELLGLDGLASADDVRRAFRAAAKSAHPDRGGSADQFRDLLAAYHRLAAAPALAPLMRKARSWLRGGEVWLTVAVPARTLAEGGRIAVDTPGGQRIVWITRKAAQAGLVRLEGLVLVLKAEDAPAETPAQGRRRAFAAAWAA